MRSRVLASPLFVALLPALALGACNLNPQPLPPEQVASRGEQDAAASSGSPGGFAADANAPPPIARDDAGVAFGGGPAEAGGDAARPTDAAGDAAPPDAAPDGGQPSPVDAAPADATSPDAAPRHASSDGGASAEAGAAYGEAGGPD